MKTAAVSLFVGLALGASAPAFAKPRHESQSIAPASTAWKAPYDLPAGFGPNDVPFAPF
jgi:hypothetical protein